MNALTLIESAALAGVALTLSTAGRIAASGELGALERWLPKICQHQQDIVAALAVVPPHQVPFDREAFEERAAICEYDGGLNRDEAEAIAWHEDERRRCAHCLNVRHGGLCKVAERGGMALAVKGHPLDQEVLQRCVSYRPCPDDPDQRPGIERWPNLRDENA